MDGLQQNLSRNFHLLISSFGTIGRSITSVRPVTRHETPNPNQTIYRATWSHPLQHSVIYPSPGNTFWVGSQLMDIAAELVWLTARAFSWSLVRTVFTGGLALKVEEMYKGTNGFCQYFWSELMFRGWPSQRSWGVKNLIGAMQVPQSSSSSLLSSQSYLPSQNRLLHGMSNSEVRGLYSFQKFSFLYWLIWEVGVLYKGALCSFF